MSATTTSVRFSRLRSGGWGLRGPAEALVEGETVVVSKRDGSSDVVRVGRVVWTDDETSLATIERDRQERERADAEELPVPQEATRTGRMLLAGEVTATVTLPDDEHVTIYARALRQTDGEWERVGLREAAGARLRVAAGKRGRRIGWVGQGFSMDWDSGITEDVKDAVRALFAAAGNAANQPLYEARGYRFRVADVCGRCGRELTDPESIDRGIGPECFGKLTDSQHAQIDVEPPKLSRVPTSRGITHSTLGADTRVSAGSLTDAARKIEGHHDAADAERATAQDRSPTEGETVDPGTPRPRRWSVLLAVEDHDLSATIRIDHVKAPDEKQATLVARQTAAAELSDRASRDWTVERVEEER